MATRKRASSRRAPASDGGGEETVKIPSFLIEYFLLGRTRRGAVERFIQDGGVVSDVWLAFGASPEKPQRVLVSPGRGTSTTQLGYVLHHAVIAYRGAYHPERDETPNVSPLEAFVALTIYFDELVRVLLPMTEWWRRTKLASLRGDHGPALQNRLSEAILHSLGHKDQKEHVHSRKKLEPHMRRLLDAAPLAALIGVFEIAKAERADMQAMSELDPHRRPEDREKLIAWIHAHASAIANKWRDELREGGRAWPEVSKVIPEEMRRPDDDPNAGAGYIERVFLDREADLASEANCAIKADAAKRVFDGSCRGITWAIIDSGIAARHPAFDDHYTRTNRPPKNGVPRRVKATLDFTKIRWIRNFDLATTDKARQKTAIDKVVQQLHAVRGRAADDKLTRQNLALIGEQLVRRLPPDWNLIEPLIRINIEEDDEDALPSDHGTHVAGILGADWRDEKTGKVEMQGVCPDIDLYDLRVVAPESVENTEFAVIAALEYVQFVNAREGNTGPLIHGVNISMSIPHKVRTYGCGATPVCVACDHLVGAGVIVVAAAGNRGWNEMEMGFGNFVSSSITDPGNAREVITVGSTHAARPHVYGVSYFSSRGPTGDGRIKPDLVAPGEKIRATFRGDSDGELDGTSQAAPFVSGAAAMLISRHRELIGNPRRVKQILLDSATDLGRERYFQGYGLVDVLRAMQSI